MYLLQSWHICDLLCSEQLLVQQTLENSKENKRMCLFDVQPLIIVPVQSGSYLSIISSPNPMETTHGAKLDLVSLEEIVLVMSSSFIPQSSTNFCWTDGPMIPHKITKLETKEFFILILSLCHWLKCTAEMMGWYGVAIHCSKSCDNWWRIISYLCCAPNNSWLFIITYVLT